MSNKKAALYIRVSTAMQADKDSLPLQRDDLVNYARYALNIDDYEIFEDAGFSAKNTDRPKYQEMMTRVRNREFSHILVWKIDRISRNLIDFCEMYEEIKKYDTAFISKNEQFDTSSAMGEAMLKIILVFAELERKLTGERVLSVMIDRASKGMWNGARYPLGYNQADGEDFPQIDADEAKTVQYIFDLYEELCSSTKVARVLKKENYRTKRDGEWRSKTITDILKNPFYVGDYRYNYKQSARGKKKREEEWVLVSDNHPAIITRDQFNRVQGILEENYKGDSQRQRESVKTSVFSKLIVCGECDRHYIAGSDKVRRNGLIPSRYRCVGYSHGQKCKGSIGDVVLLPFVFNYLSNYYKLTQTINPKMRIGTIRKILLSGVPFIRVADIPDEDVMAIKNYLIYSNNATALYKHESRKTLTVVKRSDPMETELKIQETALNRLQDLYLYSSDSMSQKDYILKKTEIEREIATIKINLIEKNTATKFNNDDASMFIEGVALLKSIMLGHEQAYTYEDLAKNIGITHMHAIANALISKITVSDGVPVKIMFKNGMVHHFTWQENKTVTLVDELVYQYQEPILKHIEKHGSIDRTELRKLTRCGTCSADRVAYAMIESGALIQIRGQSHIKYAKNDPKS
ncbi:MAG: resolvase [Firmicutes bacterium HGW-Firmicutes-4]|jgi:DNA invertase Pin-like site-specific DNA recombinase|nr:MAG: resolvase [Firmicutes bacterium HGW-Firmicutes-4]